MYIYLEEGQVLEEALLKKMEEAAGVLFEKEGVDGERAEISLTLVSLEEIRELNRDYRDVDKETDVLSFPQFEGVEDMLTNMVYENAHKLYGKELPEIVEARIQKELKSIIGNGYAVIYYIAEELVKKSNSDGFLVGSRGSVGSSFVATMSGITEVNPLKPHYLCTNPDCCYSDFIFISWRFRWFYCL